jgi:hypothetical protein
VTVVVKTLSARTCIFCSGWGHISSDYSNKSKTKQEGCPTAEFFKSLAVASLISREKYSALLQRNVNDARMKGVLGAIELRYDANF